VNSIEKSIIATISYYDIFDYPMTGFEVWRYLVAANKYGDDVAESLSLKLHRIEAGDILVALDESEFLREKIGQKFGFYFLRGREEIVKTRLWRKKLADQKWKKLRRSFRILSVVPYVRGIFVSGSLAMENSKDDSDVDIIVVAAAGRIWTVRTFMTLLIITLGIRRHGDKTKDRICLNHYITDQSLRIPFPSLYNAESYAHLVNVYAEDEEIFQRFQNENGWLREYLINRRISQLKSVRSLRRNRILYYVAKAGEFLLQGAGGDVSEKMFSTAESKKIRKDPLYARSGGRITIDDRQLEFHPESHEQFIIPEFNRRMERLGFMEFASQKDSGLNR
jgi:hypothetical protein